MLADDVAAVLAKKLLNHRNVIHTPSHPSIFNQGRVTSNLCGLDIPQCISPQPAAAVVENVYFKVTSTSASSTERLARPACFQDVAVVIITQTPALQLRGGGRTEG